MTTEQFLSQLNPDRVEQHRINYKGQVFARPYQTVFINGEEIPGLREMKQRFALFKSIFDENKVNYASYLDVGCNLSYFPRQFSQFFGSKGQIALHWMYDCDMNGALDNFRLLCDKINKTNYDTKI